MSGPKHTPTSGPWKLVAEDDETIVVGPNDEYVAFISSGEFPDDPDGLLVAAAPRLAEALKGAEAAMHRVLNTRLDYDPAAFIELKQAHEVTRAALREAGVTDDA